MSIYIYIDMTALMFYEHYYLKNVCFTSNTIKNLHSSIHIGVLKIGTN